MQLTDQQIREVLNNKNSFEELVKKQRPELFREPFRAFQWIVDDYDRVLRIQDDAGAYLYNRNHKNARLATYREISLHLEKEFKKKYKKGDRLKNVVNAIEFTLRNDNYELYYNPSNDCLNIDFKGPLGHTWTVYQRGNWADKIAEEIKDPTHFYLNKKKYEVIEKIDESTFKIKDVTKSTFHGFNVERYKELGKKLEDTLNKSFAINFFPSFPPRLSFPDFCATWPKPRTVEPEVELSLAQYKKDIIEFESNYLNKTITTGSDADKKSNKLLFRIHKYERENKLK